jgi:hypothetical protein
MGTLLLWGLHVIWHWPLFGSEYNSTNIIPWALGLMGYTFITTWLYQHTSGNLLLPSLFHTMVNVAAQYMFNPFFEGTDLIRMYWMWAMVWWVATVILYQFWPAPQPLLSVTQESQHPLAEPH